MFIVQWRGFMEIQTTGRISTSPLRDSSEATIHYEQKP
jgi:hypothetical protein